MPFPSLPSPGSPFPTYLVPSLPFRRRKSSTDSSTSTTSTSSTSTAASPPSQSFLNGHSSHLRCSRCLTDLASSTQIISKGFTGRHGRAYLVSPSESAFCADHAATAVTPAARNSASPNSPNTYTHKPVPRQSVTGAHTVSDISCAQCGSVSGWKYVAAEEETQKYKVGKFILETKKVCRSTMWEGAEDDCQRERRSSSKPVDEEVEFDSQDEDECEDSFMGVWTPQAAARRRRSKHFSANDE